MLFFFFYASFTFFQFLSGLLFSFYIWTFFPFPLGLFLFSISIPFQFLFNSFSILFQFFFNSFSIRLRSYFGFLPNLFFSEWDTVNDIDFRRMKQDLVLPCKKVCLLYHTPSVCLLPLSVFLCCNSCVKEKKSLCRLTPLSSTTSLYIKHSLALDK